MSDLRKAAEMALELLENHVEDPRCEVSICKTIAVLRKALSNEFNPDWNQVEALQESLREHMAEIQRLRQALAQPEQDELLKQGWRQCAVGQRTTQYCGMAEQARLEEREACAKLVEAYASVNLKSIAKAIRARSEK